MLLFLLACTATPGDSVAAADTGSPAADTGGTDDSAAGIDTSVDINGHWAEDRIPAPEFVATNRDGSQRSRPDLIGHPTVIWFYPAATTAG